MGLALAAALAAARVAWQLIRPDDLFLDSWVLVHILEVFNGEVSPLPRATLTLQYPLSYLPFVIPARVIGALDTVKFVYPVVSSLAAIPAYMLARRGIAPLAGALALLFVPDELVKALNGTPQGIAFVLFLFAVYFSIRRNRAAFTVTAIATLLTHHLTGLAVLLLYYSVWVLPRTREPGFLRQEWPYLLLFSVWPLYWALTFAVTNQWYLAPIFLGLVAVVGAPLAAGLYILLPAIRRAIRFTGALAAGLSARRVVTIAALVAATAWLASASLVDTPGLSSAEAANRMVAALYMGAVSVGFFALLSRRDEGLTIFVLAAGVFVTLILALGCRAFFDSLRLLDYILIVALTALFAPGLEGRWVSRGVLITAAVAVVLAGSIRLAFNYERLFAYTPGQVAAAEWIRANTKPSEAVATDTKMSLLILGRAGRHATFEGTWWLFEAAAIGPYITALNNAERFRERPITYVLMADYMIEQGAEVAWFTPLARASASSMASIESIGTAVYDQAGVKIWKISEKLARTPPALSAADFSGPLGVSCGRGLDGLMLRLWGQP
ncbi:MAG: hypothetical protein BMS9Abin14_153 [Gammaproteobacteria bacterium]|nr:MAG: hypothetical protein BMS9Abin14_153 [Gammaproteobacteria bacterium]